MFAQSLELKEVLKKLLKEQSYTYSDLAQELRCSVPTVKRILGPEEITLERLLIICEFLKISLSDLEKLSEMNRKSSQEFFTAAQEDFLAVNPNYLGYLAHLYNGENPESIQQKYRLTKKSTELYLIRLERQELLRVDSKGRVRLALTSFPRLLPNGKLIRAQYKALIAKSSQLFTRQVSRQFEIKEKRTMISVMMASVSTEFEAQFKKSLNALIEEAQSHSSLLDKMPKQEKQRKLVVSAMVTGLEFDDPEVRTMEDLLGEVTNL